MEIVHLDDPSWLRLEADIIAKLKRSTWCFIKAMLCFIVMILMIIAYVERDSTWALLTGALLLGSAVYYMFYGEHIFRHLMARQFAIIFDLEYTQRANTGM